MSSPKARRRKIVRNLQNKFRLVVMNDQTLEEKFSIRLTPMNIIVFGGTFALSLITLTLYLIAFTPLREYIPGYTDVTIRRNLVAVALKTDSVENQLNAQEAYLTNLLNVLNDNVDTTKPVKNFSESALNDTLRKLDKSVEDSLMRLQMEGTDRFELNESNERSFSTGIGSIAFFTPLKGSITTKFNPVQKHFGIDIVAGPNEVIKSSLDGTVVISSFTSETGYVIGVQHTNNIFTLYKHNSALLKSVGDYVKAGEVIAIIGNTGEFSTGPHLHFELWYNGSPVNPLEYISF
ncbi:MAG: M23 family metallopeptidase [Bacteroidetes bacterium]|nr:M23 family metallopeptidase [Bacteroidota bacterium]